MQFPPPSERQARLIWMAVTGLAVALLVALVVVLVWSLGVVINRLSPVLWPLAIAGVLAYLLDPVVDWLEGRGVPRTRAIVAVFAVALVLLGAIFGSVVPQLVTETRQLATRVPVYAARMQHRIEYWVTHPPGIVKKMLNREQLPAGTNDFGTNEPVLTTTNTSNTLATGTNNPSLFESALDTGRLQAATGYAAKVLPKIGTWLLEQLSRVASWLGVLAGLALVPVYTFYFLLEKRGISESWTDYLPVRDSRFKQELVFIINSINNYLIAFFRGQVLVAICDGILYGIGFLIIGLPYAVLIGVAAMLLTIIPFIGAITVCLAALILALVQYGDWLHPLLVLVVVGIVQALEGLVISPKIMGDRVGLHPVTIIAAVMVGTTLLGGILGGILAIPLTAALRVLMFRYIWKKRENDPVPVETQPTPSP